MIKYFSIVLLFGHYVWYNENTEREFPHTKNERQDVKMNAEMNFKNNHMNFVGSECEIKKTSRPTVEDMKEMGVISDKCDCSVFTMISVAGGVLFAIGSIVYSIIAAI